MFRRRVKKFGQLLKAAYSDWRRDKAPTLGAALAYYTIFSIAPLVVIAVAITGSIFGDEAARGQVSQQIQDLVGREGAKAIEEMVHNAGQRRESGIVATALGLGALLFGAAGVFKQLKDALNTVWNVPLRTTGGMLALVKDQFLSFAMVICIGFLLLVSLVLSSTLAAATEFFSRYWAIPGLALELVHTAVSLLVFTLFFAALFKILPDCRVDWADVWVGALLTSTLFVAGKFLIGLYLGHSAATSMYGAAGSLVVLLIWTYYSAQILLFGAEFTQAFARHQGSRATQDPAHCEPQPKP